MIKRNIFIAAAFFSFSLGIAQQYGGIQSIPTSFVIDKEGYIVSYYQGLISKEQYLSDINKALSKDYVADKKYMAPEFSLPKAK